MIPIQSYEQYVREQLTAEQCSRLDKICREHAPLYWDDSGFNDILLAASGLDERVDVESPFIIEKANLSLDSEVFDACLGSGATTIGLKLYGLQNVVSNDIDEKLIEGAKGMAKTRGVSLDITRYDWRDLSRHYTEEFDAVCCLGNSLTYILQENVRQSVMDNFFGILKKGGKLLIDTRNYTALLRGKLLNEGKGPYRSMHNISLKPLYVASDMTLFSYAYKSARQHLLLYPIKDGEMERLMINSGFRNIQTFGDYGVPDALTTEFYTFIGTKE